MSQAMLLPGVCAGGRPVGMSQPQPGRALAFTLRCLPTAQQRARHMEALLRPHKPPTPLEGGLELSFRAVFPTPKSGSKKEHAGMLRGTVCHTVKPDLDNLAKQLKDAMTRLQFWRDDKQVVRLICEKRYGEYPAWEVSVRRIGRGRGKHGAS